jgi:hypothetical protein
MGCCLNWEDEMRYGKMNNPTAKETRTYKSKTKNIESFG